MKCKRCQSKIHDDEDICPNCGQDLASLRQLLKISYEEELAHFEDQGLQPPKVDQLSAEDLKDSPEIIDGPRVILDSRGVGYGSGSSPGFSPADGLSAEDPIEEENRATAWEQTLRGGFWLRLMAFTTDQLILLFILVIFATAGFLIVGAGTEAGREMSFFGQARIIFPLLFPLGIVLFLAYSAFFHGAWGQTIGKMIFNLRVVHADGQPVTFSRALARSLAYILAAIPVFLGFFWVGFTASKRSWHDLIAGTIVVREQ